LKQAVSQHNNFLLILLTMINLHIKFQMPSFVHFKDMVGCQNLKLTLTVPIFGVVCNPKANTYCGLPTEILDLNSLALPIPEIWRTQNVQWG